MNEFFDVNGYAVIGLAIAVVIGALLIIFRKTTFVKKYWKFGLILIPGIIILTLKIIVSIRQNKNQGTQDTSVKDSISEIKDQLVEAQTNAKIEAVIAKEKNEEKMNELKEIQKIDDHQERRKRLASLLKNV